MHPLITQYVAAEALRSMMSDASKARMARQARAARRRRRTRAGAYGAKPGRPVQRRIIHIKVAGSSSTSRPPQPGHRDRQRTDPARHLPGLVPRPRRPPIGADPQLTVRPPTEETGD